MRKTVFIIVITILMILANVFVYKAKVSSEEQSAEGPSNRKLEVVMAVPSGAAGVENEVDAVYVTFNQPMVALTFLPKKESRGFLVFEPPLKGTYRWIGTSTLIFSPREPISAGMKIKVTVPAGVKSVSGAVLEKEYSWSFESLRPELEKTFPQDGQKWISLDGKIFLLFNQPIDPRTAESLITLKGAGNKGETVTVPFTVRCCMERETRDNEYLWGWKAENMLVVVPMNPLRKRWKYHLEVKAGIKGRGGNLCTEKGKSIVFSTSELFTLNRPDQQELYLDCQNTYDLTLRFSNPIQYNDLLKKISFSPPVKFMRYDEDDSHKSDVHWINLELKGRTTYHTTISGDLKDIYGDSLGKDVNFSFTTKDLNPFLWMDGQYFIVESGKQHLLPLSSINIDRARIQMNVLKSDDQIPLACMKFLNDYCPVDMGGFKQAMEFDRLWKIEIPRNVEKIIPLNLDEALGMRRSGAILTSISDVKALTGLEGIDKDSARYLTDKRNSLVQVTNLGLTVKFSKENYVIWVTTLDTAQPVEGADVELRNDLNQLIWKGKTDSQGIVSPPNVENIGIQSEYGLFLPPWIFVSKGKDTAFISSRWSGWTLPSSDHFHLRDKKCNFAQEICGRGAFLFTEKGLYRRGEEVRLKGTCREKKMGEWRIRELKKLQLKIFDPRGKEIFCRDISPSVFGSFDTTLKLSDNAPTGLYRAEIWWNTNVKDTSYLMFPGTFRVEDFQPVDFKVKVESEKQSYVCGDCFKGQVKGWYLFGAPLIGGKTTWNMILEHRDYKPPGWNDYIFGSNVDDQNELFVLASGNAILDKDGKLNLNAPLKGKNLTQAMELTVEGTVTSKNRSEITGRARFPLHSGDFYIGVKPSSSFLSTGNNQDIKIVTVNAKGENISGEKIHAEICERKWHHVKRDYYGQEMLSRVEKEDVLITSIDLTTGSEPSSISFNPPEAGYYVIKTFGMDRRKNRISTEDGFYVCGSSTHSWIFRDQDMVELIKDKAEYRPGDTARILVKSPYKAAKALVTCEREFTRESKVVELNGNTDSIEIPINEGDLPNFFVSVVLIKGRDSDGIFSKSGEDLGKPSCKYGVINIPVVSEEKKLSVSVALNKNRYSPGDEVEVVMKLKSSNGKPAAGEICVAVVDEGVLRLIDYQTPDYYQQFYSPRLQMVTTLDSRTRLIGQRRYEEEGTLRSLFHLGGLGGGPGGPDGNRLEFSGLSKDLRRRFDTTAYWNPAIYTNSSGEAAVKFRLPDSLTAFRVMAVAQTKDGSFGSGEKELTVFKPLLLKPSYPRYVCLHDRFRGGVVVHNRSADRQEVKVQAECSGLQLLGSARSTSVIKSGEEKEILFQFSADMPGRGRISFRAWMGEETDGFTSEIPVKSPELFEAVATSGSTEEALLKEELMIPVLIEPTAGSLKIATSSTALSGLMNDLEFLRTYPYYCLEQRISRILPDITAQDLIKAFGLQNIYQRQVLESSVQHELDCLLSFQKSSGGFSLWEDSQYENEYVSCYCLYALAKARESGYKINSTMVSMGLEYLHSLLERPDSAKWNFPGDCDNYSKQTIKSYALYVLYLWGRGDPSALSPLCQRMDEMTLFGRAFLLKSLHLQGKGRDQEEILIRSFRNVMKVSPISAHFEESDNSGLQWIFSSNVRTTALILQTLLEAGADFPEAPKVARWLIEAQKMGRWRTTQENIFAFDALRTYFRIYEKSAPDFSCEVRLGDRKVMQELFNGREMTVREKNIDLKELQPGSKCEVTFDRKGLGRLYYTMRLRYAPLEKMQSRNEGISISKSIEPVDQVNPKEQTFKAGVMYKVTLNVITPQERTFVAVEDPIPGGFVVVNAAFSTEKGKLVRAMENSNPDAEKAYPWTNTFNHFEIYDDKVLVFADVLNKGKHHFTYFARALFPGSYRQPPAKVEQMYEPEVFGYSDERIIDIK